MEEELRSFSLEDDLTGLYNRRGFFALAQQHMKIARRQEEQLFMIFIDLDDMKLINDNLGHLEGDHALIDTADILKKTFRESDIIARLGGDEFAVLSLVPLNIDSGQFSKRLQSQLDAHNARGHRPYQLAMSVGIVRYDPRSPIPISDLLAHADAAMYEQKRAKHEIPKQGSDAS
jgi:diguanylate cyclase (GGDEF)-like protein